IVITFALLVYDTPSVMFAAALKMVQSPEASRPTSHTCMSRRASGLGDACMGSPTIADLMLWGKAILIYAESIASPAVSENEYRVHPVAFPDMNLMPSNIRFA